MDFIMKRPYEGNEKPIMQHVQGATLTEWRVSDDRNSIVREQRTLLVPANTPRGGTFFLGGMETTRDELADYLLEANERNLQPKPDRIPDIQARIMRLRERHVDAIKAGVRWKQRGYQLPKQPLRKRRALLVPTAIGEVVNGKIRIIGVVNDGRAN